MKLSENTIRRAIMPNASTSPEIDALVLRRKELGLSQSDVASAMGVDSSVVCRIERGRRRLTDAAARKYEQALNDCEIALFEIIKAASGQQSD